MGHRKFNSRRSLLPGMVSGAASGLDASLAAPAGGFGHHEAPSAMLGGRRRPACRNARKHRQQLPNAQPEGVIGASTSGRVDIVGSVRAVTTSGKVAPKLKPTANTPKLPAVLALAQSPACCTPASVIGGADRTLGCSGSALVTSLVPYWRRCFLADRLRQLVALDQAHVTPVEQPAVEAPVMPECPATCVPPRITADGECSSGEATSDNASIVSEWEDWVDSEEDADSKASAPEPKPVSVVSEVLSAVACSPECARSCPSPVRADASAYSGGVTAASDETSSVLDSWEDFVDVADAERTTSPASVSSCPGAALAPSPAAGVSECWCSHQHSSRSSTSDSVRGCAGLLDNTPDDLLEGCPAAVTAHSPTGAIQRITNSLNDCGSPADSDARNNSSSGIGVSSGDIGASNCTDLGGSPDQADTDVWWFSQPASSSGARGITVGASYCIDNGAFERTLGEGGFGRADLYTTVFPDGSIKQVVVKTLFAEKNGKFATAHLQNEAFGLSAGASCPYIVDLLACSRPASAAEPHQLVMEYVAGGSLENYIYDLIHSMYSKPHKKRGKGKLMSYKQLRKLAAQMLEALAVLHSQNMCHRDIKPDNILLGEDEDGGVCFKLADFGLAEIIEDGIEATPAGSLLYMAPETNNHRHCKFPEYPLTLNQDLASLGYVLAFCGGLCVTGGLHAFKSEDAALPDTWDPAFADLVLQLTRRNPWERISASAALQHPFVVGKRSNARQQ